MDKRLLLHEQLTSGRLAQRYRCYYARYSPHVGQGSRTVVELYDRGVRWSQNPTMRFDIAVDPPFLFTVARLNETHVFIRELEAADLEEVFARMQVDRWPEHAIVTFGEEIHTRGLTHSTMCPGDIVEDVTEGRFYECDLAGWRELE